MSMTCNLAAQEARLEMRVTSDLKALLEKAAALRGYSSTKDYILATVEPDAQATVANHSYMKLNAEAATAFVQALLKPRNPDDRMKRALERHAARFGPR